MKNLVVGVVYKGVENYLDDYITSIIEQNYKNFDLLIFNDGVDKDIISNYPININVIESPSKISPAKIRQNLIDYAILNGYENVIFTDCDDVYSKNLFEKDVDFLSKYDFVFNDIILINKNGSIINDKFYKNNNEEYLTDINCILSKNIIGMSNSAVKINSLKNIRIPSSIIAVDWYIFSILLINNKKGKFIPNSKTYYRQHKTNLVGATNSLTEKKLLKGIKVKKIHYYYLSEYCENNNKSELAQTYRKCYDEISELEKKIDNKEFLKNYMYVINKNFNKIYKGWWSEILPLNEWRKYAK